VTGAIVVSEGCRLDDSESVGARGADWDDAGGSDPSLGRPDGIIDCPPLSVGTRLLGLAVGVTVEDSTKAGRGVVGERAIGLAVAPPPGMMGSRVVGGSSAVGASVPPAEKGAAVAIATWGLCVPRVAGTGAFVTETRPPPGAFVTVNCPTTCSATGIAVAESVERGGLKAKVPGEKAESTGTITVGLVAGILSIRGGIVGIVSSSEMLMSPPPVPPPSSPVPVSEFPPSALSPDPSPLSLPGL
jgi:hypothetical protein